MARSISACRAGGCRGPVARTLPPHGIQIRIVRIRVKIFACRRPTAHLVKPLAFVAPQPVAVAAPARLHVDVEYRFYAGLPWFRKSGTMRALKEFEAPALRDDEWVFTGQPFTDIVWMGPDGKLRTGPPASGSTVSSSFHVAPPSPLVLSTT